MVVEPWNRCRGWIVMLHASQIIKESREWLVTIWTALASPSLEEIIIHYESFACKSFILHVSSKVESHTILFFIKMIVIIMIVFSWRTISKSNE
jgi:hypothetical protein